MTEDKKLSGKKKKKLYSKILSQMEFYFSDSNLAKDRFVKNLIDQSCDGYIDLQVFTTFNKVKALTEDVDIIADAILRSEFLELNSSGKQIRRVTPVDFTKDFDACTIYVEKLPSHADSKWIHDVFGRFGKISYTSIPYFKASQKIKGFAFIEFDDPSSAKKSCEFYKKLIEVDSNETEEDNNHNIGIGMDLSDVKEDILSDKCFKKRKRDENEINDIPQKKAKFTEEIQEEFPFGESSKTKQNKGNNIDQLNEVVECHESTEAAKKPKRKHKHKKRCKSNDPVLKVMPKSEWKALRNKYLDLQRSSMAHIKKWVLLETEAMKGRNLKLDKTSESVKKCGQFQPGVILKVKLLEPIQNPSTVKDLIKGVSNVAYVDAPTGCNEIFVRCHSPDDALVIFNENKFVKLGSTEILKGDEEEEYWKKIENERKVKYNTPKIHNHRGRDKLIAKATKLSEQKNKHIFFEE